MSRNALTVFLAALLVGLVLFVNAANAAPITAEIPDNVIATTPEDAATCKDKDGCMLITKEALAVLAMKLQRIQELEEIASRLAAELKKKPVRSYCI